MGQCFMGYFVKTINKCLGVDFVTIPFANNGYGLGSIGSAHGVRKALHALNPKLDCGLRPTRSPDRLGVKHKPIHIEDNRLVHIASLFK